MFNTWGNPNGEPHYLKSAIDLSIFQFKLFWGKCITTLQYFSRAGSSIKITRHLHTSLEIKIKLHNNLNVQAVPTFFKFNN